MVTHILTMPRMGETMEEGRIVSWLVEPGDGFRRGDALVEIETDKTVVEFPALADGTLSETLAREGDQIAVGAPLARIEIAAAADWPDIYGAGEEAAAPVGTSRAELPVAPAAPPPQATGRRATPLARRLARQNGIDIATIAGSGRRGRVEKADVMAVLASGAGEPVAPPAGDDLSFVDLPQGRLAFLATGPEDGAPVLLIHGFAADHTAWAATASGLARAGRRVVAIDLPGHGATTLAAAAVADLGTPLAPALDALPTQGRLDVVAHSLGAVVAVALADARADRIASLTLVAPAGLGLGIDAAFVSGMARATAPGEVAHLLRRLSARGVGLSAAAQAAVARLMATGRLRALAEDCVGPSGQRVDIIAALEKVVKTMSVRVIFGLEDRIIPWQQVSALPAAVAIHLIAGAGHMPHWDEPRMFLDIVTGGRSRDKR